MGLRATFNEQGFGDPSIDLLQVLFDIHCNKPHIMKTPGDVWVSSWKGPTGFYYLSPRPRPRFGLTLPGEPDLLTRKPSNVKGWRDKYFVFMRYWFRREDLRLGEENFPPFRKFRKFKRG